jgi:hypothetical protein
MTQDIAIELKKFKDSAKTKETLRNYLNSLPSYGIYELASHTNSNNIEDVNNLAFFLKTADRMIPPRFSKILWQISQKEWLQSLIWRTHIGTTTTKSKPSHFISDTATRWHQLASRKKYPSEYLSAP